MVVPTENALHEAIQVAPLVLSDNVKRHKASKIIIFIIIILNNILHDYLKQISILSEFSPLVNTYT